MKKIMTLSTISQEQFVELKENYLFDYLLEVEGREPRLDEIAHADEMVSNDVIFDQYGSTTFTDDDFTSRPETEYDGCDRNDRSEL